MNMEEASCPQKRNWSSWNPRQGEYNRPDAGQKLQGGSFCHVRDLPKSQLGVDVDNDFDMKYITIKDGDRSQASQGS